jgi:hypothetical protein
MTREQQLLEALAAIGVRLHKTKIEEQMQILINELQNYTNLLSQILEGVNEDDTDEAAAHKRPR